MSNNKCRQRMKQHFSAPMSSNKDGVVYSNLLLLNVNSSFKSVLSSLLNLLLKAILPHDMG